MYVLYISLNHKATELVKVDFAIIILITFIHNLFDFFPMYLSVIILYILINVYFVIFRVVNFYQLDRLCPCRYS